MHFPANHASLLSAAIALAFAVPAQSQSVIQSLGNNVRNTAGDSWSVWTAPFRGKASDWLLAAAAIGASAAISPLDDEVDRWSVRHRNDGAFGVLKELREGGAGFSGQTITPVALGALAFALATNNQRLQEGLFGCATAYLASSAVRTFAAYPLVARTRPDSGRSSVQPPPAKQGDQYDIEFPGTSNWGRHSLPAGHIANIAACASFLTQRFSMGPVPEVAAYAVVAGVGLGRVLDRRHWSSDTAIGLVFAYAVGKQIAVRSSERERKSRGR